MTTSYRTKVDSVEGENMSFEIYEFVRKTHGPTSLTAQPAATVPNATAGGTVITLNHSVNAPLVWRQVKMTMKGGSGMLEPGALQYALGRMKVEVKKLDTKSNILSRAIASSGTGESGFATLYEGHGEVWTEPTSKFFIAARMEGPADALLLDDKAFYACEGSIALKTHRHNSIQGMFSGNGLVQPKLEGRGAFVIECPVPPDELETIELDGSQDLIVDGDLMLMYSASLEVELKPLVRGLRNFYRSGEGLVYKIRGKGTVYLTPTLRMG